MRGVFCCVPFRLSVSPGKYLYIYCNVLLDAVVKFTCKERALIKVVDKNDACLT